MAVPSSFSRSTVSMPNVADGYSLHGENAARRRAIGELIFFASINDRFRCKKIVDAWKIDLDSAETCADYDRRTPLHVAAAEGAYTTTQWLLEKGAPINAVDRFGRTPLEDAVRGEHSLIVSELVELGAKICENGALVLLQESGLAKSAAVGAAAAIQFGIEAEWEIDPQELTVLNKLGEGEFGEVYKAKYNGTYVAMKRLKRADQIALGDFKTEMSALRRIHHPNAVQFLGACTRGKEYIIVTELMSCSLRNAFSLTYRLTIRRQLEIALEFSRAMAYMHARTPKIIHRDLKPANIMIGGSTFMHSDTNILLHSAGIIKVADFGLSKSLPKLHQSPMRGDPDCDHDGDLKDTYKLTGETGSYRYMAPEVFLHEPYNTSVDVYSFAMICYQLFEGLVPFEGIEAFCAAQQAALHNLRPHFEPLAPNFPNKEIHEELRALMTQCWAQNYSTRPSFPTIISKLENLLLKLGPRKAERQYGDGPPCCSVQ